MSSDAWINLWSAVLWLGLGSYFLGVLVVAPLGARDIVRLFARLDARDREDQLEKQRDE